MMSIGGTLQRKIGVKWTITVGSLLVTLSTFSGYFTVNNYTLFCATYGVLFGIGIGIAYSSPMTAGKHFVSMNVTMQP